MFGFLKGKIEIKLDTYSYAPGDTVKGTVVLTLKKPAEAKELSIQVRAQKQVTRRDSDETTTRTDTVFDFKQPLDGAKVYDTGQGPLEYPFEVKLPGGGPQPPSQPPSELVGALGTILSAAQAFSDTHHSEKITWQCIARLDVKGFDITEKVQINVA